jgi:hypothetical protein
MLRRLILLLALPAAALSSACSSSGSGAGSDPASAVPAGVPFYVEVTLRPEGDARDGALAAAGKVLRTDDPAGRIRELLQEAGRSGEDEVDFAKEIEPWLGDRAGMWVAQPPLPCDAGEGAGVDAGEGAGVDAGAVVAVRDAEAARTSLHAILARQGEQLTTKTADGREYEVGKDGMALAVTDDFAVVASSEAGIRRGLAALDGEGLASEDRYAKAVGTLPENRLAHYFVDVKALVEKAMAADPGVGTQLGPLQGLLTAQMAPQAGSFSADGDRLVLESVTDAGGGLAAKLGSLGIGEASPLLTALPDAWGALAVPKAGASLRAVLGELAGALGGTAIAGQLRGEYGIDLEQDVFSWMGDAGLFVRGAEADAVDGALVIEATDEAKAAAAFGKAVGLLRVRAGLDPRPVEVSGADGAFAVRLPDAPQPAVLARGGGRVVVAYGAAAAESALGGGRRVGDSAAYGDARKALDGYEPAGFVSVPAILALVDSAGAGDAEYRKAKPYLEAFSAFAAGSRTEGDTTRSRAAAGLR